MQGITTSEVKPLSIFERILAGQSILALTITKYFAPKNMVRNWLLLLFLLIPCLVLSTGSYQALLLIIFIALCAPLLSGASTQRKFLFLGCALLFLYLFLLNTDTYRYYGWNEYTDSYGIITAPASLLRTLFINDFAFYVYQYYIVILLVSFSALFVLEVTKRELDEGTMTFYIMQPVSRVEIYLWKFIGYLIFSTVLLGIPITILYCMLTIYYSQSLIGSLPVLFKAYQLIFIGFVAFGSLFFLLSLITKKPFFFCLVYGYIDQLFIQTMFTGFLGWVSLSYQLHAYAATLYPSAAIFRSFVQIYGIATSTILLPAILVITTVAGIYIFKKIDIN